LLENVGNEKFDQRGFKRIGSRKIQRVRFDVEEQEEDSDGFS
jgi:hypothetical protein